MNNNNEQNSFSYSYSGKEQEELKRIREKYIEKKDKEENKLERLRRLDSRVTERAQAASLIFGVVGALTLGFGMSLIMTDLFTSFNMTREVAIIIGVFVGVFGGALASLAYPVYKFVLKREKEKVAPEIIRLTDELIK